MLTDKPQPFFVEHPNRAYPLIIDGLLLFALTTYSLRTRSLLFNYDRPLRHQMAKLREAAPSWLGRLADVANVLGGPGTLVSTCLLSLHWLRKGQQRKLSLLLFSLFGWVLFFLILAQFFDRERPKTDAVEWVGLGPLPGYPSGHLIAAVAHYGALLYIYLPQIRSRRRQLALFAAVSLWLLTISFSRLYKEAHFLTDLLASYGLGVAWTAAALSLVDRGLLG